METELLTMSTKEMTRLELIQRIENNQISQIEGAKRLGLSTRQTRRLQQIFRSHGVSGLISKRRGRPSNNQIKNLTKAKALHFIKSQYWDFGPTFAHEKLTQEHGLKLSVESVRKMMIAQGLWRGKKRKTLLVHQMRERRSCYGELVQIGGSTHDWFQGRGPKCCLLVYVDDATSTLMHLLFVEAESTQAYFKATKAYIKKYGRPLGYYSDKHTIFRVQIREAKNSTGDTQFGRALKELGIELICAHSPHEQTVSCKTDSLKKCAYATFLISNPPTSLYPNL